MKNLTVQQLPILLQEDTQRFDNLYSQGKRLFPQVKVVGQAYDKLRIGFFSNQVYQEVAMRKFSAIEQQVLSDTAARFDALNLRSETMRTEAIAGAYSLLNDLKNEVENLSMMVRGTSEAFPLDMISINSEGEPEITEERQELIKERFCRTYLRTPEELTLHTKLEAAAEACNAVWAEVKAHKATHLPFAAGYPEQIALLMHAFLNDKEKLITRPGFAGWVTARYAGNPMHSM